MFSLPSYGKNSLQNLSSKPQTVKKSTKSAKKRKATQPIPIPIPSRSDALTDNSSHHEYSLEIFSDIGSERGAVRLTLRETQNVEIEAFNILGKRVAEIYTGEAKAGMNTVSVDLSSLSNGVYICVVRGRHFKTAQKFIVTR